MRKAFLTAVLAALSGCAASDRLADSAPHGAALRGDAEARDVRQVAIESFADEPVCTRRAPTGSRIAVEHCVTKSPAADAMQAALQNQARDDLDEMRRRQIYQEQARQHALREALMRSRGRP